MEVLNLISLFLGVGTYSLYRSGFLHFRYLKCLVIFFWVPGRVRSHGGLTRYMQFISFLDLLLGCERKK